MGGCIVAVGGIFSTGKRPHFCTTLPELEGAGGKGGKRPGTQPRPLCKSFPPEKGAGAGSHPLLSVTGGCPTGPLSSPLLPAATGRRVTTTTGTFGSKCCTRSASCARKPTSSSPPSPSKPTWATSSATSTTGSTSSPKPISPPGYVHCDAVPCSELARGRWCRAVRRLPGRPAFLLPPALRLSPGY